MITIESMRGGNYPSQPWHVRVDRSSVLGNPFGLRKLSERDASCDNYLSYFNARVRDERGTDGKFIKALDDLVELYKVHGKVTLFCWCAPLRCHAETIKSYLEDIIHG